MIDLTDTSSPAAATMTTAECLRERAREARIEAVRCDNRDERLWAAHWRGRAVALDEVATELEQYG